MNQKASPNFILILLAVVIVGALGYVIATRESATNGTINTITDETANWKTYENNANGFELKYPNTFLIQEGEYLRYGAGSFSDNTIVTVVMPYADADAAGTNLTNVFLNVDFSRDREDLSLCLQRVDSDDPGDGILVNITDKEEVNGQTFYKDTTRDAGVGHYSETISYRTIRNQTCYEINLVAAAVNAGNFPEESRPRVYNRETIFNRLHQIFTTFRFK